MKPLEGITIIEISTMITASFAAMMMAEQGADVIKIESLDDGDPMRYLGTSKGGVSALFGNANRGKKSLRLDLKNAAGANIVKELASTADVLLCNFRPGVMDGLGLGSEMLRELNPRLIYVAISGFGTSGPERNTPAYDPIIQAQSGFTAVQGADGPEFVRNIICDKTTAYTACQGATAALYLREKTGNGQHIDLSMMDAGLYFLFPDGFMNHTLLDDDVEVLPPQSESYELKKTKDGGLMVGSITEAQWIGFLTVLDKLELLAEERFSPDNINANMDEFEAIIAAGCLEFTTKDLAAQLKANDVPVSTCFSYEEVLAHPQYAANGSLDIVTHPTLGTMRRVKPPAQFGGERLEPGTFSPAHGEHTQIVLKEMGKSDAEIAALVSEGAIVL